MKSEVKAVIVGEFTMKLTEVEARALEAIAGYGLKNFLDCFYTHLGKSYLEKYESGVKSLFDDIRCELSPQIERVTAARKAFHGEKNES